MYPDGISVEAGTNCEVSLLPGRLVWRWDFPFDGADCKKAAQAQTVGQCSDEECRNQGVASLPLLFPSLDTTLRDWDSLLHQPK